MMPSRERLVVCSLVAALVLWNVLGGAGSTPLDRSATADPTQSPPAIAAGQVDLLDADGTRQVTLRGDRGHLAWGPGPAARAYSQAFVNMGALLEGVMARPALQSERDALVTELNATETSYRERLGQLSQAIQSMPQDSPEAKQADESGRILYEEYMAWQRDAIARRGRVDAVQLERAYQEILAAVRRVAGREGIDVVHRFVPADEPFDTENPEQAMMAIRLRSALVYPDGLDLTDRVRAELGVAAPATTTP